jgi:hypothetical protein
VTDWKVSLKAVALGTLSGTAMGLLGFFFLTSNNQGMGGTLFLLVPVVAGFTIAMVARRPNIAVAVALLSVLCSLAILIGMGREGTLCAILALPLILGGLAIGVGIGALARKLMGSFSTNSPTTMGVLLLAGPILIVGGDRMERPTLRQPRTEVIQNSVDVNDSPEHVWANILSIDHVQADKPILMYIGLPVPQRCTLQGQGVGAKRTCYFDVGYIEETVTAWNPPYNLGLSIDRTHMPGRHWLGFESAEYKLESMGPVTRLTRTTTVISHLEPVWYWRHFERLGVESEHKYILQDVASRSAHN